MQAIGGDKVLIISLPVLCLPLHKHKVLIEVCSFTS